jgi:GGDEF domain-containing protein
MISIQSSLSELERSHQLRAAALDAYIQAIRNIAHYPIELDDELTTPYRKHLEALAGEVGSGSPQVLADSRATLRGLLRDYRDKATEYLANLRDELAGTARSLEEVLDSLGQADGDHETNLRAAIGKLRQVAATPGHATLGSIVSATADSIENSLEQLRKQHQLTTSQFLVEIRMLHKRIDTLESAVSVDEVTRLATREDLTLRIASTPAGQYCLLLVCARGLRRAEVQFGKEVGAELCAAFAKRLRNSLPMSAVIGRWGAEEFVAILTVNKSEAVASAKWITEHLSGAYACLKGGKTVHPVVQPTVGVVETAAKDDAERIVDRIGAFLVG